MDYQFIVIGSGPGGYVAAIRAAQLGLKTAIIEKYNTLGGTCLNIGCIPTKALLDSSEHFYNAKNHFEDHGIELKGVKANLKKMIDRKRSVVKQNCDGIEFLMKKNKIDVFHGLGSFQDKNTIKITGDKDSKTITGDKILIATGSKPIVPPAFNYDKKRIITSTEALEIEKIPKKIVVIGAGVIGLELGSVFSRLGAEVSIIEFMDMPLAGMDKDVSRGIKRVLSKMGIKFYLKHEVTEVKATSRSAKVSFKKKGTDIIEELTGDYCIVAIGRRAYTDGLGLENIGVNKDERGKIIINANLQTPMDNVFAIGDVVKGPMLAHKAEEEGVFVAEFIAGQKPHINYNLIPGIVYTWPEVAAVGKTEEQLKENGTDYKVGKFPFKALGRARASGDVEGMVKIIADKQTDEVLGVHIVGARAADIIAEAVALMEFRASAEDIARICHGHPTYTEAMKEAALDAWDKRPIHS